VWEGVVGWRAIGGERCLGMEREGGGGKRSVRGLKR